MSEAANLAGGKVTYLDGHIANKGSRTVTGVTVQVLFRTSAHEVAQNETQPLKFIRIRDPYVDLEPVAAAPRAPGAAQDFRLIFDAITAGRDGADPEFRAIHFETKRPAQVLLYRVENTRSPENYTAGSFPMPLESLRPAHLPSVSRTI